GSGNQRCGDRALRIRAPGHAAFRRDYESGPLPSRLPYLCGVGLGDLEIIARGVRTPGIRNRSLIDDARNAYQVGLWLRQTHHSEHEIGRADEKSQADRRGSLASAPQRQGEGVGEET